jgi:hypothetical protein
MSEDSIITALQQQLSCYRRLARLAELQHEHVQQQRVEELIEVLSQRQTVLDHAMELEKVIAPARRQWAVYVERLNEPARHEAESLFSESRELLERITAADQADAMVLQQRKLNIGRELGAAAAAKHVNRSYAAAAYEQGGSRINVQR